MKFNRKIVAAMGAVAMLSTGAAYAATLSSSSPLPAKYSLEGLQLTTGDVSLPDITITFGNNLSSQDDLFITLVGATAGTNPLVPTCVGTSVGYIGKVGNTWNYYLTDPAGATVGATCTFTNLKATAASLAAGNTVNVNFQATRFITGQPVDSGTFTNVGGLAVVRTQFGISTTTPLNAVIDVFADRTQFVDLDPTQLDDTLVFNTVVDNNLPVFAGSPFVDATNGRIAIIGDWSWADDDGDGNCGEDIGGYAVPTASLTYVASASNCTQAVFDLATPNAASPQQHTVIVSVPGDVVLDPIDWAGTVVYDYELNGPSTKAGSKTLNWDPGQWDINGAQVYINYMPFGDNISRIIYAANEGDLNATVTVDAFDDQGNEWSFSAGAVPARTVTKLSQTIDEGLRAEGFGGTGKVAMRLTFTAPDKDIEVYSAYNVGNSDRGTVVNTSNGRTFFYGLQQPLAPPPPAN